MRRPVIPAIEEVEAGGSQVQAQRGIQSESKASPGNSMRSCFQMKSRKRAEDVAHE